MEVEANLSELRMKSCGIDRDRAAIGVIAGVDNELVVERQGGPLVEAIGVIGFQYLLLAVIKLAVADQNAETTQTAVVN